MKIKFNKLLISFIMIISILDFNNFIFCDDISEDEPIDIYEISQETVRNTASIAPKIVSRASIVMDTVSGRVLYEKNAYSRRPMASTTKIMTAIVALEEGKLNDIVTVNPRAARIGGSSAHLVKGEKLRLEELLYGLMLPSGNDAAIAIAEHIGGTVENFASMMTNKAKQIGAYNTAFVTPHGLDKDGHFTTAYDLAVITRYALRNKKFSEIVGTYKTIISAPNNGSRVLRNTNEMLAGYYGADGVKTGYTGKAGRCLVTSATRDNWRVISVVLGSNSRHQRSYDSTKILNYVFNNYRLVDLNSQKEINISVPVWKGKEARLEISVQEKVLFPLSKDEINQLNVRYDLPQYITAPIEKGTKIG
ncbi:MAG TPA: D-alanyl-D-alanine carboxypeptidase, partial [Clostridiales bacterium]|nr:D-alanyl-D-alanine carboxypeptidase [Clostridiales bacterium]